MKRRLWLIPSKQARTFLLRCSTCRTVFASVTVSEGTQNMYEFSDAFFACHPTPSGDPGVEVEPSDYDPLKVVRRWLGVEEPKPNTGICFKFYDGKKMWFFSEQA